MKTEIVLFLAKPRNLKSSIITTATNCIYVHAAIKTDSWLDASIGRGDFNLMNIDEYKDRHVCRFLIEFDHSIIRKWMGKKYDYKSVLFWNSKRTSERRVFCFQVIRDLIKYTNIEINEKPSGCDIYNALCKISQPEHGLF